MQMACGISSIGIYCQRDQSHLENICRSSSDSKGPAMTFMAALDIMNEQMIKPDFNLKVIMDTQEEIGVHLGVTQKVVLQFKEKLTADYAGSHGRHPTSVNEPTLMFGAGV
ncbi:MAG: hypothetical protein IPK94_06180 [Saprospiraceae bacterium]|nr:hypothetical protein [Saprospiraceae bacterium]